jgi:hypothetical protein
MSDLLDEAAIGAWFAEHYGPDAAHTAFRLELLPAYAVDSDGDDFRRWLAGEPEPTWKRKNAWLKVLRDEHAAGLRSSRVRVISEHPTDYERYASEWGYALNAEAGEDIRVWHLADQPLPPEIMRHDFWLVGDEHVLVMHYDTHGRFEGASTPPPSHAVDYQRTRDVLWAGAEPFMSWWARHPELRRTRRAA